MARYPENDEEVVQRAKVSRERAAGTAKTSTKLLQEAARLEETVRKTEEQLRELKATLKATKARRKAR